MKVLVNVLAGIFQVYPTTYKDVGSNNNEKKKKMKKKESAYPAAESAELT